MKVETPIKLNTLILNGLLLILLIACSKDSNEIVAEGAMPPDPEPEIIIDNLSCNSSEIFANETTNAVCFEEINNVRKVYTNNFPAHEYGPWPGPNNLLAQDFEYTMCLYPELTTTITELKEDPDSQACGGGIIFGVSNQGINYSPFARLYWVNPNTQEENLDWHVEADFTLGMDLNGGHVNSVSRYHYHNIPTDYFTNDLEIDGSSHSPILGYAADGFPIYYKHLYTDATAASTSISDFSSGYALRSGSRPGDGVSAPDGGYDGTYIEDYEYTGSDLDECGGRYAITPEYPDGTYYYVLTDNWPYIPRCFKGKYVDNSFRIGQNCPGSTASQDCSDMEVLANAKIYKDLELKLNSKLFHQLNLLNLDDPNLSSEITQINIYKADGSLVYTSDPIASNKKTSPMSTGVCYVQMDFLNGQIIHKISI
jgi:hypothetical protein